MKEGVRMNCVSIYPTDFSVHSLLVEKQFTQMLEMMISVPKWTLRPWKTTMESQLGSWTMYIPGVGSSNEMKEMKSFKDMIDAMTDEEIDHPLEKLNGTARERISRSTGKSTDDVTRLLFFFKQSLIVSTWLQERYVTWFLWQSQLLRQSLSVLIAMVFIMSGYLSCLYCQEKGQRSVAYDRARTTHFARDRSTRESHCRENVRRNDLVSSISILTFY